MRRRLSEKSTFTLHMLHMSDMLKEKDIRRKSNRGGKSEGLNNVGGRAMRAPTTRREIATVRCVCNAGLHHCNGQMYLQPSVAPPSPVGARIARPFIPDVIITLREGARRVIGATAKPLYAIDGKAVGLDRRIPQDLPLRGRGTVRRRWKEYRSRLTPSVTAAPCQLPQRGSSLVGLFPA